MGEGICGSITFCKTTLECVSLPGGKVLWHLAGRGEAEIANFLRIEKFFSSFLFQFRWLLIAENIVHLRHNGAFMLGRKLGHKLCDEPAMERDLICPAVTSNMTLHLQVFCGLRSQISSGTSTRDAITW